MLLKVYMKQINHQNLNMMQKNKYKINGALNNVTNQIDETIICFYDDSSNTYYEANPIGTIPAGEEDNVEYYSVGALISNPSTYNYNGTI